MIYLQWEMTASLEGDAASPAGDAVSPAGDLLASPNFGICDTTLLHIKIHKTSTRSQEYQPENIYRQLLFQVPYIIYHYLETEGVLEQISSICL